MSLWQHQAQGVDDVFAAIARGSRRILLTSPTGGGKTRMTTAMIDLWLESSLRVVLYSNRKLLIDQLSDVLEKRGIQHGVRASGHHENRERPVQVSSFQTENARVLKKGMGAWGLHKAERIVIDEAHVNTGEVAREIMRRHLDDGAVIIGLSATPIGLGDLYEELVVAGTNGELRSCGAHVPLVTYGCDEPDLRGLKKRPSEGEDFTEGQVKQAMMTEGIFGRVFDWYQKLNPEHKPTILFAPGVSESLWFTEQFHARGITAAHIDGQDVWVNGEMKRSSRSARQEVLDGSRSGDIKVICNRFVMREGIDCPWLAHGIFATIFGSLQSYLQSGGRLQRSHAGIEAKTLQDHGGNWWRHGSLNQDREWFLDMTAAMATGLRSDRIREKREGEPFRCPTCGRVWTVGTVCSPKYGGCGYVLGSARRSRPVVQSDGTLKLMVGDIYKPHRVTTRPDGAAMWKRMYFRSRTDKGARTFNAAMALFAQENNWGWPSKDWPLMPTNEKDFYRLVGDVDRTTLRGARNEVGS